MLSIFPKQNLQQAITAGWSSPTFNDGNWQTIKTGKVWAMKIIPVIQGIVCILIFYLQQKSLKKGNAIFNVFFTDMMIKFKIVKNPA